MIDCNGETLKPNDKIYVVGMNGNTPARVVEEIAGDFIRVKYGNKIIIAHHKDQIVKRID